MNGLRHPRSESRFVRSPSLSGGRPLITLGAKEGSLVNMTMNREGLMSKTETRLGDPATLVVDN